MDSIIYLSFTNVLNSLYETKTSLNTNIIKIGFTGLKNIKFLREIFIKQAMGRVNLTG